MRRRLAAAIPLATAVAAACLSIPPFRPRVLLKPSQDATGTTVDGSNFSLHFAGGSQFHLPDHLKIDGTDVLGHAASPCWGQTGTGFGVIPMPPVSGDALADIPPAATNQIQVVLGGPAVVQVRLDWSTHWTSHPDGSVCSPNPKHTPGGTSTFTVFPDGRIVRHDILTDANPDTEQIAVDDCKCPDVSKKPGEFILSSYWAFSRTQLPQPYGLGDNGPELPDMLPLDSTDPPAIISQYPTICLNSSLSKYQVASVWVLPTGAGSATYGYPDVFSHDVQKDGIPMLDFPWDVHGALFIEHSDCTAALKRAIDYSAKPMITINGHAQPPSQLDGIYGGDLGDGKKGFDLPSDGKATLSGDLKGPFAVWLRFPDAVVVPVATSPGKPPSFYVPQQVDDRSWILWFLDPLVPGETITVAPD
jgi:hypothetical protein